jgi:hypothetical protein
VKRIDPFKDLGIAYHPLMVLPPLEDMAALSEQEFEQFLAQRGALIEQEAVHRLAHGYEPPIWWVCDCLLNFPWVDAEEARKVREHLGFDTPIRILMINGGNRGGKTQYCARTLVRILNGKVRARVWAFQYTEQRSIIDQQPYVWNYLPLEWRKMNGTKEEMCYITYKEKMGFGNQSFIGPNGSMCEFKYYKMDRNAAIEGGDVDFIHFDETVPADWVDTSMYRIATKNGRVIVSFTPVDGYTPTVRAFRDGSKTVKSSIGYLLPTDGGEPDEARALGLSEDECREVMSAFAHDRLPLCEPSRAEDCRMWLDGKSGQPAPPEGRTFESVPRVDACADSRRAIVYFYSADNPFGGAANVVAENRKRDRDKKLERFYGYATKQYSLQFPLFNRDVHVIPDAAIPDVNLGTIYFFCDPAGARKFFMKWYLVMRDAVYLFREWPGDYEIPGYGFPGPWAVPDGDKLDGRKAEGQKDLGWGLAQYKQEIARLEGWACFKPGHHTVDTIAKWDQDAPPDADGEPTRERVELRFLDSRAASTQKMENDRPSTLLTDFEELNLHFELTPGMIENEGIVKINDALYYNPDLPIDYLNRPRFYIAESCKNTIFSYEIYTGQDGQKAACKDPIDLDRYFFLSECEFIDPSAPPTDGGGSL